MNLTKSAPYRHLSLGPVKVKQTARKDGSILLESTLPLESHPHRMTEKLVHWAVQRPTSIFLGERNSVGDWETINYATALSKVKRIAQFLLDSNVSTTCPLVILSENSIDHGLMALGALHVGLPYSPVAPAYSLRSSSYVKLKHVVDLLTPSIFYVSDGLKYERALAAVCKNAKVIVGKNPCEKIPCVLLEDILKLDATQLVDERYQSVQPGTVAKILFTSGSTGMPKGVINTQGNITTNWQQIVQTFPFVMDEFTIVDWLPWNHTFGGNHNFGLTLYVGGTMYIDRGSPTPEGIKETVQNLKEIAPTIYFNVPRGFSELAPYLEDDSSLRELFFSKLRMLFYAGAGMPQHLWDTLDQIAINTIGERIVMSTGLGCTESSPAALFSATPEGFAGLLGLPVPGLSLKLVPVGNKLEARYKGENVTPGYWRGEHITDLSFDEEGFYKTGDALRFADADEINRGLIFDGRILEDFKLDTGTWVHVSNIRANILTAAEGLVHDVVITGHDRPFIGAILFLDLEIGRKLFDLSKKITRQELVLMPVVYNHIQTIIDGLALVSTGSATLIKKVVIADFELSFDAGELTDKGTVNQHKTIETRAQQVDLIYSSQMSNLLLTSHV